MHRTRNVVDAAEIGDAMPQARSPSFSFWSTRIFRKLHDSPSPQDQRNWLIVTRSGKCRTVIVWLWTETGCKKCSLCPIERPFFVIDLTIALRLDSIVLINQFYTHDCHLFLLLHHFRHCTRSKFQIACAWIWKGIREVSRLPRWESVVNVTINILEALSESTAVNSNRLTQQQTILSLRIWWWDF